MVSNNDFSEFLTTINNFLLSNETSRSNNKVFIHAYDN